MSTADVVIIGAGLVGCSVARSLSLAGLETVNIDPLPAPGYGSTSHSSAIIRPFYSHVTACAVAHESRARWLSWPEFLGVSDERGMAQYRESGGMVLLREDEEHAFEDNLAALDEVGVSYQIIDAATLAEHLPGIDLATYGPPRTMQDPGFGETTGSRICGAILIPACGHVSDPQLAASNLYAAATHAGGTFLFATAVTGFIRDADTITGVELDNGERVHAPVVVNAAGPHSSIINALAGAADQLNISTQAQRHEVAYVRAPASHGAADSGFLVDLDGGFYARRDGADFLIGSTDPPCDPVYPADPDDYNDSFTEQWTLQVYRAGQRFPGLEIESKARGTVGLYDVSDDWIPIYDKTHMPGYYLAIGTSGNQFKNAPVIGDIMAAIIMDGLQGGDHDASPCMLHLPNLAMSVDLSFYSRNRVVQETASVMA